MSREDDLINNIDKNLQKQYSNEYFEASLKYGKNGKPVPQKQNPHITTQRKSVKLDPPPEEYYDQSAYDYDNFDVTGSDDDYDDIPDEPSRAPKSSKSSRTSGNGTPVTPGKKKKKRKKKHKARRIIIGILIGIVVLIFVIHALLTSYVSKTDYEPYETDYERASDVKDSRFVTNILIVGCDARNKDNDSRSDCMIIASINRLEHKIVLSSILRDTYVTIPGHGGNKINAAFQFGGPALLIQTIEENFKVGIDYYIKTDFFSFVDIIDELGGVDIDVSEDEKKYVNSYLNEINNLLGYNYGDSYLTNSGMLTLNGRQALSYSRIRYIGTDFERTSRQREVINAVLSKMKSQNIFGMMSTMNSILPELTTNIPDSKLAWYIMEAPFFMGYSIEEFRVPADDTWKYQTINGLDAISIDFNANIEQLQDAIY